MLTNHQNITANGAANLCMGEAYIVDSLLTREDSGLLTFWFSRMEEDVSSLKQKPLASQLRGRFLRLYRPQSFC